MTTAHERAAEALLDKILLEPKDAAELAQVRADLAAGRRFSHAYVDSVGQVFRCDSRKWPPSQAAAFTAVFTRYHIGRYATVQIGVGARPRPDRCRSENATALKDLVEPFEAEVDLEQNSADQDGHLRWGKAILMERTVDASLLPLCPHDYATRLTRIISVEAGFVPLEIGFTMPSRTLAHLELEGGVARWPYDSDVITLFINVERFFGVSGRCS